MANITYANYDPTTWRECPGFPGYYVNCNGEGVGSMRRTHNGNLNEMRLLKLNWAHVYPKVSLYNKNYPTVNNTAQVFVHRLVLEAFVGPCPEGMETRHFPDFSPSNFRLDNLRWDTREANCAEIRRNKGEAHHSSKLTEEQVLEIRCILKNSELSLLKIARQFDVTTNLIFEINEALVWSHILTGKARDGVNPTEYSQYPAKLNQEKVKLIKSMFKEDLSDTKIAELFNVSRQAINNIRLGKSWISDL